MNPYLIAVDKIPSDYIIPDFPFRSQRDNEENPDGACNVTSLAMCALNAGIVGDGSRVQLEDQMYDRATRNGWSRHHPVGLKKIVESYGLTDDFTEFGRLLDIKHAVANNIGCVLQGYFTLSGHIIVVKGYDKTGFFVNDPWGEWFPDGYDHSVTGESLHYSDKMIARLCSPESLDNPSNIYLHRIYRTR